MRLIIVAVAVAAIRVTSAFSPRSTTWGRYRRRQQRRRRVAPVGSPFSTSSPYVVDLGHCGGEFRPIRPKKDARHRPSTSRLSSASAASDFVPDLLSTSGPLGTAAVVASALVLGIGAQTFINSMLNGDRGLGAFLSDGSGYGRSGFRPRNGGGNGGKDDGGDAPLGGSDPLPWLKLPDLDFVEVAGQEKVTELGGLSPEEERLLLARLEDMVETLRAELKAGNIKSADAIRAELEGTMEKYGIRYDEGFQ